MNIEELSKSQLILLTILVNFVTSVATGILTVSLNVGSSALQSLAQFANVDSADPAYWAAVYDRAHPRAKAK